MFTKTPLTFAIFLHSALALSMGYPLCVSEPGLSLEAGKSSISAIVHSPMEKRCEATMHFSDPSFLPLRYSFDEVDCDGSQVLEFTVPPGSPNGDVGIIWQCTGLAPSCNHGVIFGGDADLSLSSESMGEVGCLVEVIQTRTASATVTRSSKTFVEVAPTVVVTTTTRFQRRIEDQTALSTWRTKTKPRTDTTDTTDTADSTDVESVKTVTSSPRSATTTTIGTAEVRETDEDPTKTSAITLALEITQQASETTSMPTDDGVFVSNANKTPISIIPAVTASIISTLTVYRTVTARCTS
ncbi:uncharacterized protein FTOL_06874 [Fusarium torulosum]|uniref:Uncharacterized protein n=1 Tax=Fusarium torulosum TaxID=33205 RepID=A0AAE8MAY7_9HYPO|nr:uncharacterized protein FTOL_06874 [Fusarium torulosum]